LIYSSCAFSRASRASMADKYSASGLLMAAGGAVQVKVLDVPVLVVS
jgi:hypothetical protein